jgi:hypothetical protein
MKISNLIPCTFLILLTSVIITSCQKSNDANPAAAPTAQTPASISGGGKTTNGIGGTDNAAADSTNGVGGTGASTNGISGGGKTADGVGGTGK